MIVPSDQLKPETLRALIEEFVSRDGAIHGHAERTLEQKVAMVMSQLKAGTVAIVFDADDETCSIVERRSLNK
jgi:uncharacterized protein YheU (UPF0270 family)